MPSPLIGRFVGALLQQWVWGHRVPSIVRLQDPDLDPQIDGSSSHIQLYARRFHHFSKFIAVLDLNAKVFSSPFHSQKLSISENLNDKDEPNVFTSNWVFAGAL